MYIYRLYRVYIGVYVFMYISWVYIGSYIYRAYRDLFRVSRDEGYI